MYRTIVARKVRATFHALSAGDERALTSQLAARFSYRFVGGHALGGTRTSVADVEAWFARVFRLFPGLRFDVVEIAVKGPPWRTVVLTQVAVEAEGYRNEMFQRIDLAWGRITGIVTMEDLTILTSHLAMLADQGHDDANASPIVSATS